MTGQAIVTFALVALIAQEETMTKYRITLEITTELNPNKWNWSELLDLSYEGEELNWIDIEKAEEGATV